MTIESRPEIENAKEFNQVVYATARRDRLSDLVMDYLSDEDTSPRQLYEDLLSEVKVLVKYHEYNATKAKSFLNMISDDSFEAVLKETGYDWTPGT